MLASNKLAVKFAGGSAALADNTLSTGGWLRIDLKIVWGSNPHTITWRVDGTTQTNSASYSTAAGNATGSMTIGSTVSTDRYTAWFDDLLMSTKVGDYPLPDGGINIVMPNSSSASGSWLRDETDALIDANSYTHVDELPFTPGPTDYLKQIGQDATGYIELGFTDIASTNCINAVGVVAALAPTNGPAENVKITTFQGATEGVVASGNLASTSGQLLANPIVVASGGWDRTKVNAMVARMGYTSISSASELRVETIGVEYDIQ